MRAVRSEHSLGRRSNVVSGTAASHCVGQLIASRVDEWWIVCHAYVHGKPSDHRLHLLQHRLRKPAHWSNHNLLRLAYVCQIVTAASTPITIRKHRWT